MIPKINSITQAETITSQNHPHAVEFQSNFDGTERIGFTYDNGQGGYSWINGDGTTSARQHTDRDTARNEALNTHRSSK